MNTFFPQGKMIALLLFIAFQSKSQSQVSKTVEVPVTKAELGTFPYLKSLPNFRARNSSDSITLAQNKVYVFDGKQYHEIEGKESKQLLSLGDRKREMYSIVQLVSEYTKLITALGGKKLFEGKLPAPALKTIAGTDDFVTLSSNGQLAPSAFMGVVQYLIKTPEKEIWVQLQPHTINSEYYGLIIIEKENKLINGNITKENKILADLEKSGVTTSHFSFEPDQDVLLSESKDELLNLVAIFQAHKDWKISLDVHLAPVGDSDYSTKLSEKRASAIKAQLVSLGVNASNVEAKGWGDQKPLVQNKTEAARIKNERVEIKKL